MIRFIDLRGQEMVVRFTYFDTVTDLFVEANGTSGWDTFAEFEEAADPGTDIERFRRLTPDWANVQDLTPAPEDIHDATGEWRGVLSDLLPGLRHALKIVEGAKRRDLAYGGTDVWMSDDPDGEYIDRGNTIATIEAEIDAQGKSHD